MLTSETYVTKLLEHYRTPYLFRPSPAQTLKLWESAVTEASTREFTIEHSPYVSFFFNQLPSDSPEMKVKYKQDLALLDNWVTGVQHIWLRLCDIYEVQNLQQLLDFLNGKQGNIIKDAFISLVLAEKFIAESYDGNQARKSLTVFIREMQVLSATDFLLHESRTGLVVDRCLPKTVNPSSPTNRIMLIPLASSKVVSLSTQKSGERSHEPFPTDDEVFKSYSTLSDTNKSGGFCFNL